MSRLATLPNTNFATRGGSWVVVALIGMASATAGLAQPPISVDFEPKIAVGKLADFTPLGGFDTPDGKALEQLLQHGRNFNLDVLTEKAAAFPAVDSLKKSGADPTSIAKPDLRFKLVKFTGKLSHITRAALPPTLEKGGVTRLYEVKVTLADRPDPLYLVVAALPDGVVTGPQSSALPPITGAGYFVKVAQYPGADILPAAAERFAPVVVAPSFTLVTSKSRYDFDGNSVLYKGILDFTPLREGDRIPVATAYDDLVRHAMQFDPADLAAAATEMPVTEFLRRKMTSVPSKVPGAPPETRLRMEREGLRFKLLKVNGQLKRIIPLPVSDELRASGVANLYEVWILLPEQDEAVCAVVTELPKGVEPASELKVSRPVTIAGYFLKVIRYESGKLGPDKKPQGTFAPLFIGRSIIENEPRDVDAGGNWRTVFLPAILTGLGLLTALLLGLTWWFKASDRAYRKAIEGRQVNPFAEPGPDTVTPDSPSG